MNDRDRKFDYLYFARAYLVLASLGLNELTAKNETGQYENPVTGIEPDFTYDKNYLLAPIIFNIKHSVEIFLKTIAKFLELDVIQIHDLILLFEKVKGNLPKKGTKVKIQELEELLNKYYQNNFFNAKPINVHIIKDGNNDLFRYPESNVKIGLDFEKIFPQFTTADLEVMKNDIKKNFSFFDKIGREILKLDLDESEIAEVLKKFYQEREN